MGVQLSPYEASLWLLGAGLPDGVKSDAADRVRRKFTLLKNDIERVADWQASHG